MSWNTKSSNVSLREHVNNIRIKRQNIKNIRLVKEKKNIFTVNSLSKKSSQSLLDIAEISCNEIATFCAVDEQMSTNYDFIKKKQNMFKYNNDFSCLLEAETAPNILENNFLFNGASQLVSSQMITGSLGAKCNIDQFNGFNSFPFINNQDSQQASQAMSTQQMTEYQSDILASNAGQKLGHSTCHNNNVMQTSFAHESAKLNSICSLNKESPRIEHQHCINIIANTDTQPSQSETQHGFSAVVHKNVSSIVPQILSQEFNELCDKTSWSSSFFEFAANVYIGKITFKDPSKLCTKLKEINTRLFDFLYYIKYSRNEVNIVAYQLMTFVLKLYSLTSLRMNSVRQYCAEQLLITLSSVDYLFFMAVCVGLANCFQDYFVGCTSHLCSVKDVLQFKGLVDNGASQIETAYMIIVLLNKIVSHADKTVFELNQEAFKTIEEVLATAALNLQIRPCIHTYIISHTTNLVLNSLKLCLTQDNVPE